MVESKQQSYYYHLNDHKIILWGNTNYAHIIKSNLCKEGYEIYGLIEKNKTGFDNTRIIELDDLRAGSCNDDVLFILCMRSAFNQEMLAEEIFKEGYGNIICIPLNAENQAVASHMRKNYQQLLFGEINRLVCPRYNLLHKKDLGYRVIEYYKERIEILINVRFLRTFFRKSVREELLQFRDKHISDYRYFHELYDYLFRNGEYPWNYLEIYMDGTKDDSFLLDRKKLYETFKNNLEKNGIEYFLTMPISVEFRGMGLNITDGMHRASFLYNEGVDMVPVTLLYEDFDEFLKMICKESYR